MLQEVVEDDGLVNIYISRLRRKRKDVVERRRIKSLGRVIRLGGNGTPRRTSSPIELYRR